MANVSFLGEIDFLGIVALYELRYAKGANRCSKSGVDVPGQKELKQDPKTSRKITHRKRVVMIIKTRRS